MENLIQIQKDLIAEMFANMDRARKWWELWRSPLELKLGQTAKDVIYQENKASLYRYHPRVKHRKPIPVLIVYALINRLYILDLYPGRSFVEFLLEEGFDVFAVDWGVPGDEDRDIPFDYFIEGYLHHMVERVLEHSSSGRISLFGYCIGGTMAAIYAALHAPLIKNLVLLTTPINFAEGGYLKEAVDKDHFPLDALVDTYGNIPPWMVQTGFRMRDPLGDLAKSRNFFTHMLDEDFVKNFIAIETWVNDNIPFPGAAYRKCIKEFYQENRLYRGVLEIFNQRVDLKDITASHLSIAGREDTIVPPKAALGIQDHISSKDSEVVILPGGHIGVIIGGRAVKTTWPRIGDWLESHPGSAR